MMVNCVSVLPGLGEEEKNMDLQLKNKVFLVTGGSKGIGRAVVLELLKESANVVACARNETNLQELSDSVPDKYRSSLRTLPADVLCEEQMKQVTEKTVAHFGRLDGVVAGAGGGSTGTVLETPAEDWRSQYEIKVGGVLNTVKPAVKELLKAEAPRIVIINGITANIPDSHMAAVSASRAAVKQVAYMLAQALAPDICVNTINLGAIDTERQLTRYKKSQSLLSFEAWKEEEAKRRGIPFGRLGRAEEVTPVVLLLLSPLSSYITGSSVDIDGGLNIHWK